MSFNVYNDATECITKEGDKTYEYGWLDKVLKVTENGKTLADFEYHNNGQIAKAIRPDKTENFLWDGLALVKRDDTKFINEPHAGGGNPVLAIQDVDADKSKVIFTDMLGTSLGSTVEDQYNNITKTSFGADTTDTSAFFTGKPYIRELGYAFLFRNYRADTGKWLSQDLIGYPDGWNNYSYCGNISNMSIDYLGCASRTICSRNLDTSLPYLNSMQHTWTEITLTPNEYNNLDSKYKTGDYTDKWKKESNGNYTVKMSAYEEDGKLVKKTNDPRDTNPLFWDTDSIEMDIAEKILEKHRKYNNSADYDEIPYWGDENNCNSYTNTINNGDIPDALRDNKLYPGINFTIKSRYFE